MQGRLLVQQKWPTINGRAAMKAKYMRGTGTLGAVTAKPVSQQKNLRQFLKSGKQRRHRFPWAFLQLDAKTGYC